MHRQRRHGPQIDWSPSCPFVTRMKNAALLVIDVQRGAFDGERCEPIAESRTLVGNTVQLISAARASGTPVIFIQHCDGAGEVFEEGSPHWALHESLVPQPGDRVLNKYQSSAFEGTALADILEGVRAEDLLLCGLQSEFCVSNTAKAALAEGFGVFVAQDGHSTWPSKAEPASAISERVNRELEACGAKMGSTADLVRSLREAST